VEIDPRGPRFGALVTTIVLAIVLITGSGWLLTAQAVVFAAGALLGLRYAPYGVLYRWLVRPRLGPPKELEPEAPPRFAQGVGMVISAVGVVGYATGVSPVGIAFTALALVAAALNGVFGLCLGCEMYLIMRRTWPRRTVNDTPSTDNTSELTRDRI
jgi:Domain of unknown function (DUF4395)